MVKKKGRSRKQGMFSKAVNIGLTALSLSTLIKIWLFEGGNMDSKARRTLNVYTGFGFDGTFVPKRLIEGYAPVVGAFAVGTVLKFIRKRFPVR